MSLINDALKRAKQSQKNQPAPPIVSQAPLVTAAPPRRSELSLLLLLGLGAALMIGGGLVLFLLLRENQEIAPVVDKPPVAELAPAPAPKPVVIPPSPVAVVKPKTERAPVSEPAPEATPPVASAEPIVSTLLPAVTKSTLPVLQGIFYRWDHPSAVLNGKTVLVGAAVGDFKVLAITQETVTIGNESQTNVLRLPN